MRCDPSNAKTSKIVAANQLVEVPIEEAQVSDAVIVLEDPVLQVARGCKGTAETSKRMFLSWHHSEVGS